MRVMLDSNILISALIFDSQHINEAVEVASQEGNRLLLPTYVIGEVRRVVEAKWPNRVADVDLFLQLFDYDEVETPEESDAGDFDIRDAKDRPVVLSAIAGNADILVTGDKDFADVEVEGLRIMHPVHFAGEFGPSGQPAT
ncbi:MAG: putative toxin-antitoxin system toxin component, PIN family [Eggerthellaceae bacterium]|nr:putative toxin-antitoxin system toxin component, PIN family [Eggerthellaceae bacterium]MBQ9069558.1 putative toxin-antitoxin system toxin component, PIN family [Eggerthellaceae bacterium]